MAPHRPIEIWPTREPKAPKIFLGSASPEDVESWFERRFPATFPVFFSSGRAGLRAVMVASGLKRQDRVWTPPYASHCVHNAIAFVATPTAGDFRSTTAVLAYHQWGFALRFSETVPSPIEDSVDSICLNSESLFPNGGRFEIFSLPKIDGGAFGGIVLCRSASDRVELRKIRTESLQFGFTHHVRRLVFKVSKASYSYWANSEPLNGALPAWLCSEAISSLSRWDENIADRKKKLTEAGDLSTKAITDMNRLPVCLPLPPTQANKELLEREGIQVGVRNLISIGTSGIATQPVLPLPIHHQVPLQTIQRIADGVRSNKRAGK